MVIGRCRTRGSYKVVGSTKAAKKDYRTSCPSGTYVDHVRLNGDYFFVCNEEELNQEA